MSERISIKTRLRIVNGCLALVTISCLAPTFWPSLSLLSGYVVVVVGMVAVLAYFIGPAEHAEASKETVKAAPEREKEPASTLLAGGIWEIAPWKFEQNALLQAGESIAQAEFAIRAAMIQRGNLNRLIHSTSKRSYTFSDNNWVIIDDVRNAARAAQEIEPLTVKFGKVALKIARAENSVFLVAADKMQTKHPRSRRYQPSVFSQGRRVYH
jgi:hypothetical protein